MKKLTAHQYWSFHTQVYLDVANYYQEKLWLREKTYFSSDEKYYLLSINQELIKTAMTEEKNLCEVKSLKDITLHDDFNNFSKNIYFQYYENDKYVEIVLTKGNKQEIAYFLENVIKLELYPFKDIPFHVRLERVVRYLKKNHDGIEVLYDLLKSKKINEQKLYVQLKIKKMVQYSFKEKLYIFEDLFENLFNIKNANEIVMFLSENNNVTFVEWLSFIDDKNSIVPIVNEYLKNIKINEQPNKIQVDVRDTLIENFSEYLSLFSWIDLLQNNNNKIFKDFIPQKVIPLIIDLNDLQKSYPLKSVSKSSYFLIIDSLANALKEYNELKIENIFTTKKINNNVYISKWMVELKEESLVTEQQIKNSIVDMFNIYMPSIIEGNENIDNVNDLSFYEQEEWKENLIQWLSHYFLSMSLNENLTIKSVNNSHKL